MAILKGILVSVLIIFNTLTGTTNKFITEKPVGSKVQGIIIPHHLLVGSFINKFYSELLKKNQYDQIIILSPNHFDYGYSYIQTTNNSDLDVLIIGTKQEEKMHLNLDEKNISLLNKNKVLKIEPKYFAREHGITSHISFLNKYYPNAKIIPIIIKVSTPQQKLDSLAIELNKIITPKTLIIGSIDFSHYTEEFLSVQNDLRTIQYLKKISQLNFKDFQKLEKTLGKPNNKDSIGIDSPPTLYLLSSLMMKQNKTKFHLWGRTSTASLTRNTDPANNTSHIFGWFD